MLKSSVSVASTDNSSRGGLIKAIFISGLLSAAMSSLAQSEVSGQVRVISDSPSVVATPSHSAFDQLLTFAVTNHPLVKSSMAQLQGSAHEVSQAQWAYWPRLSLNAAKSDGFLGTAGNSSFAIEQTLWSAGAVSKRVAAAKKTEASSRFQVEVTQTALALRLVDAWAGILDAQATIDVSNDALEVLMKYKQTMQRRVKVGLSSALELRLLMVRVSRAQTDLDDAIVSQEIALQRLSQLSGLPVQGIKAHLASPLPGALLQAWTLNHPDFLAMDAVSRRVESHPAIQKAKLDVSAAADNLAALKSDRWPKITLRYEQRIGSIIDQAGRNSWVLGLNYFTDTGLAVISKERAQESRLQAQIEEIEALRQEKHDLYIQDWSSLRREFDRQSGLQGIIEISREVLASYDRLYFAGLKSWIEVLNALQDVSQSELRVAQAANATTLAYYRFRLRGAELPSTSDWKK